MLEQKIQERLDKGINVVVPWYLMLSYGYYCLDESIVSDTFFDNMAKIFLENYDNITHRHRNLVSKDDLKAGTLYHMRENDYPLVVRSSFVQVLNNKGEDL